MTQADMQLITGKSVVLGEGMGIVRTVPTVQRRQIGAWCFLDHFGPVDVGTPDSGRQGMRVGPHPHIGLQTVTWLLSGEILHRDSLGSLQVIRPGQLNLMTSGRGISHSEESPAQRSPVLHGAQMWIALPEHARHCVPAFAHHAALPVVEHQGLRVTVMLGEALGERSPGIIYSTLVGLELHGADAAEASLPLDARFEYGLEVLEGELSVAGETLRPGQLLYLGPGRTSLSLQAGAGFRALLLGGEPMGEDLLVWWNFVGRTREELTQACREWNDRDGYFAREYGQVLGYDGTPLTAPMPPWAG